MGKPRISRPILPVRCPKGQHADVASKVYAAIGRRHNILISALLLGCGLSACGATSDLSAASAEQPGPVIAHIDGRKLSFHCSGRGAPTVLLESGFGADATAWFKVEPVLAERTRVCAYDRASYGDSDPGPLPRDGAATARDLDLGLRASGIQGPYVIVGHSAGGLYARLFAARRPTDVRGLILLDPTVARRIPRAEPDGLGGTRARVQRCLDLTSARPRPMQTDPQWAECVPRTANEREAELARHPATWHNRLSELDNIFRRTSEQVGRIGSLVKDIPLYVITASQTADRTPMVSFEPTRSAWELQHQQIAATSLRGFQTTVISSHLMMLDRPDVIIAAALEMISASRANRLPGPLPPSETSPTP